MVVISITAEYATEITEAFSLFDTDGRGCLPSSQLGSVLRSFGQNPTEAELIEMNKDISTDGKT